MRKALTWQAAPLLWLAACALLVAGLIPAPASADEVVVESRQADGAVTPDPPYQELNVWGSTSAKSTASGLVGTGSRYACSGDGRGVVIKPTLAVAGGNYRVEYTKNAGALNVSNDVVMAVTVTGGTGLPATTEVFQGDTGSNTWLLVGDMQLDPGVTQPEVRFEYASGTVSCSGQQRLLVDSFRFTLITQCLDTPEVNVAGPLGAGQTTVTVTGIKDAANPPAATLVKVYQIVGASQTVIGSIDPAGAATVDVPTSALVKDSKIYATQVVSGQEGCEKTTGLLVGSGPNPPILLSLGIRETNGAGPIGSDGGTAGTSIEWLGPKEAVGGAPMGKLVIPSNQWQTITFDPLTDPVLTFNATDTNDLLDGAFGTLEHLAVAPAPCGDGDPGNYRFYLDNVTNGGTVITDFDTFEAGVQVIFRQPSFSGSTSANLLLPTPNFSGVDVTQADSAPNSYRMEFQFLDAQVSRWVRITSFGAPNVPNPQIDLTLPISVRILLPPAAESGNLAITNPSNVSANAGADANFSVTASGATGPVHYQWYKNGLPIIGSDTANLTLVADEADNGAKILATACDNLKRVYSAEATLTVLPPAPVSPGEAKTRPDGRIVSVSDVVVTYVKAGASEFWAQAPDRSSGIRFKTNGTLPSVNQVLSGLVGTIGTDAATTERFIDLGDNTWTSPSSQTPDPLNMVNKTVSGQDATGGKGVTSVGLLAKVWGKVTGVDMNAFPNVIYIDDGSGVANDTPIGTVASQVAGLKVITEDFITEGSYVTAVGVVRLEKLTSGDVIRVLEARGIGSVVTESF